MIESLDTLLDRLGNQLADKIRDGSLNEPVMVGIHTGGVWVAERLHASLGLKEPLGKLNIAFYRDDFTTIGLHPQVSPSLLPFEIEGRDIILVDDVLFTGRTIRAALNELFDYGRPRKVLLAVLFERDGRELPIQADVYGQRLELTADQQVKLTGPEPLLARIVTRKED
ncbi:MAG TPA: bifunctional pyr operon transcriptional regulator/uracil phosphoribosyltransferase PyrR [Halothiobacillus sp.]|nr:bifunctional pyr operon transcriptional regulator/uracil phosphoribosyltransferase PyrR [Halothiobacillus sp.]